MTAHKHLKQLVRTRMEKTGESYSAARRHIIRGEAPSAEPLAAFHFPGNVPATTALRVLLAQAGVNDTRTGRPFSEAMLFGIAGGIGIGHFAFHYEKEDFSSFFVAGRHKWADDLDYLVSALKLFGLEPVISESSGAGPAAKQLSQALDQYGASVAWVDACTLPHRAMPAFWSGGGYHVVTVYSIAQEEGVALIGDLTDAPVSVDLADLAAARARIVKQKNRVLSIRPGGSASDLDAVVRSGLRNGVRELESPSMKGAKSNFQLQTIRTWGGRMFGSKEKESWDRVFRRGGPLFVGLKSVYDFIEHYGTGGGLCRPLFADFLREAADLEPRLAPLADRYAVIGAQWSDLANAALPDDVPLLRETKETLARKAEMTLSGAPVGEIKAEWARLEELENRAREDFPLSENECLDLRAALQKRVFALHEAEEAAFSEWKAVAAG